MFLLLVIQIVLSLLFSSHHFTTASNEIGKSLINKTCSHTEFPGVFASQLWSQILAALVQILLTFLGLPWSWPCPKLMPNETLVKAYNLLKNASTHNQFVRSLCFTSLNVTLVISKRVSNIMRRLSIFRHLSMWRFLMKLWIIVLKWWS